MSQTKVLVWGNNNQNLLSIAPNQCLTKPQQIIFPFQILKITATQKHISFITINGDVYSYGANTDGRLGIGAKDNFTCIFKHPVRVNLQGRARQIKSGFSHTCVQLENNQIYAWGLGEYGSLGVGQFRSKYVPTKVLVPPTIVSISCGAMHTAFIDFEGNMYMCGSNEYGQLGVKSPDKIGTPLLVPFNTRIKQVACGVFYTLILTQNGDVYGMGNNKYAQLGLGHKINQLKPTLIHQLTNIVKIQAGYHSGALNAMCQLFLWGCGSFGELLRPKKIILNCPLSNLQIRGFFGVAISESQNRVFIWGNNTHGQLGNGGYISYKTPTQMKDLSGNKISRICCGVNFALAIIQEDHSRKNYLHQRVGQSRRNEIRKIDNYQQGSSTGRKRMDQLKHTQQNLSQRTKQIYHVERSHSPINKVTSRKRYDEPYSSPQKAVEIQSSGRKRFQQGSSINRSVHFNQTDRYQRDTTRSYSSHQRNYQDLFMNLSKDYETLAKRYRELESQIQEREIRRSRDISVTQAQLYSQSQSAKQLHLINDALKQQAWSLQKELIICRQDLTIALQKISILEKQIELRTLKEIELLKSKVRNSPTKSPSRSPTRSPIKIIENKKNDDVVKQLNEKDDKIRKLQEQKQLLNERLNEQTNKLNEQRNKLIEQRNKLNQQKCYSNEIQSRYKQLCLRESQNAKIKANQPSKQSTYKVDLQIIQNLKKIIRDMQQSVKRVQNQKLDMQDKLAQQKIYVAQIEAKYRNVMIQVQNTKLQNINLRQTLLKSQDRIGGIENDIRKMVSQKQYENAQKQLIENKSRVKQLQQKLTKIQFTLKSKSQAVSALQQQRLNLYNMLQNMKNLEKENKIISDKRIDEQKQKTLKCQQKIKEYEVQVKYQKDYSKKLQEKGVEMDRLRDEACKQLQRITQSLQKQKKRKRQLQRQVQGFKTTQNELKITRQQLQKQRQLNEDYKDKVIKQYRKKDNLIKQIQQQLQQKQSQLIQIVQKKQNDINRLKQQIKKYQDKLQCQKLQVKKQQKEINLQNQQIQNNRQQIQKLQRKLKHNKQITDKQIKQRQQLVEQVGNLKRDISKIILQKQQLQKKLLQLQTDLTNSLNNIKRQKNKTQQIQNQLNNQIFKLQSIKQQNSYMRSQLDQANNAVQQANKISQQLSIANKQFSQNQSNLHKQIQQLQAKVYQLQDQNRSYTPKYDALIQRNKQLDQRNKQLSDMVNKAIEIQAQSYKQNILKQVQVSTNQIINDVQDQKIYKQRFNRKYQTNNQNLAHQQQDQQHSYSQHPQVVSRIKQQPYTKYMNEKIQSHRRRVSESAQKLAGILDLDSNIGSVYSNRRGGSVSRRMNDDNYQKINNHMQSLKGQKQAFMSKINSFAQKMKLL